MCLLALESNRVPALREISRYEHANVPHRHGRRKGVHEGAGESTGAACARLRTGRHRLGAMARSSDVRFLRDERPTVGRNPAGIGAECRTWTCVRVEGGERARVRRRITGTAGYRKPSRYPFIGCVRHLDQELRPVSAAGDWQTAELRQRVPFERRGLPSPGGDGSFALLYL